MIRLPLNQIRRTSGRTKFSQLLMPREIAMEMGTTSMPNVNEIMQGLSLSTFHQCRMLCSATVPDNGALLVQILRTTACSALGLLGPERNAKCG